MVCLKCARCCEEFTFEISGDNKEWINQLGVFIKLTRPQLMSLENSILKFKAPCQYLDKGKCTIYENRPEICKNFLCKKAKEIN